MSFSSFSRFFAIFLVVSGGLSPLYGLEYVKFREDSKERQEEGRVLLEAQTGTVFEARDGQYFVISPENLIEHREDTIPFAPFNQKEMRQRLEKEFPKTQGFNLLEKDHFFIVYTTSQGFASWYGVLLEKVYVDYVKFWKERDIPLRAPDYPMVVILFSNRQKFFQYAASENTQIPDQVCAYYNKKTNRTVMCDLSGMETDREGIKDRASSRNIRAFLEKPGAASNIATVVHEAVHQVGFNCGMHRRFVPYPLWVCEGLALFHEVPDRGKQVGWTIKPKPNDYRIAQLRRFLSTNPVSPLQDIIQDDSPLLKAQTGLDSYAMAWGLTWFLVHKRPKEFTKYLKLLSEKTMLTEDSPEIRIKEFESCFGSDWQDLYKDCGAFLRSIQ